jgi:DNA invertase Pin-like site-specific DNA recombinase
MDSNFDNTIENLIQNQFPDVQPDVDNLAEYFNQNTINNPPVLGDSDCYEVECLLDSRLNQAGVNEYLVKWKDNIFEPSWEVEENISSDLIRSFLITNEIVQHNNTVIRNLKGQKVTSVHLYLRVSDSSKTPYLFKQAQMQTPGINNEQSYFSMFPSGNFSLESQKEQLLNYCVEHNMLVKSIEMDDGISARNLKKLVGLQKIVSKIESGEMLLVLDLSRFARNTTDGLQIIDDLHKRNVRIYSVLDGMNYDTPASRHCVRTTISCAELESDIKSAKLKASIQNIKNMGGYVGNRAPFGKKIIREGALRKLVDDPKEKNIIQMIVKIKKTIEKELIISNKHYTNAKCHKMIVDTLAKKGIRMRGKPFTSASIANLIKIHYGKKSIVTKKFQRTYYLRNNRMIDEDDDDMN